jgi:hypothetical protein
MPHNKHIEDGFNIDIGMMQPDEAKNYYLWLAKDWTDPNPPIVERIHEGVRCVRDDLITGSKIRGADLLMSSIKEDTVAYVQPRTGLAGVSILDVASKHGKKVRLYMPSSKKISHHQACCIERGALVSFHRIAAMPNLNKIAKEDSKIHGYYFIPLGLKHKLMTAGMVKVASQLKEPDEVYVATSTGVLSRALQIAWPNAKFTAVAVARNMKAGELGRAKVISEPRAFTAHESKENLPPFPNIDTYDGKVWKYIPKNTGRDILFWNVGAEPVLNQTMGFMEDATDSYRDWAPPKRDNGIQIYDNRNI